MHKKAAYLKSSAIDQLSLQLFKKLKVDVMCSFHQSNPPTSTTHTHTHTLSHCFQTLRNANNDLFTHT